jgi:hypothetical protein
MWAASPNLNERSIAQSVVFPNPFAPTINVCRARFGLPAMAEFLNRPIFLIAMIFLITGGVSA